MRLPLSRSPFLPRLTPVKTRYAQSNEIISGVKAMETPGTGLFRSSLASGAATGLDPKFQDQVSGPATCIECACLRICWYGAGTQKSTQQSYSKQSYVLGKKIGEIRMLIRHHPFPSCLHIHSAPVCLLLLSTDQSRGCEDSSPSYWVFHICLDLPKFRFSRASWPVICGLNSDYSYLDTVTPGRSSESFTHHHMIGITRDHSVQTRQHQCEYIQCFYTKGQKYKKRSCRVSIHTECGFLNDIEVDFILLSKSWTVSNFSS